MINNNYLGNLADFEAHIRANSSGNITVYGSHFTSVAPVQTGTSNSGIFLVNTSLTVAHSGAISSTFNGFYYGILATHSGTSPVVKIYSTHFENNLYGVAMSGINYAELLYNKFNVTLNNSCGALINSSTGYKIEENIFLGNPPNKTTGLVIFKSGGDENEVYLNEFYNLRIGQQFLDKNSSQTDSIVHIPDTSAVIIKGAPQVTGLQTICNRFEDNQFRDILVGIESQNNIYTKLSIRQNQGSMQQSAGNKFITSLPTHFENKSQHNIEYFYGTKSAEIPTWSGLFNLNGASSSHRCTTIAHPPPDPILPQYDEWNEEYEYWLAQLLDTEEGSEEYTMLFDKVSYLSALKDNYFNGIIVAASGSEVSGERYEVRGDEVRGMRYEV